MNMQPCSCKKTKTLVEISVIRPRQWLFFFFLKDYLSLIMTFLVLTLLSSPLKYSPLLSSVSWVCWCSLPSWSRVMQSILKLALCGGGVVKSGFTNSVIVAEKQSWAQGLLPRRLIFWKDMPILWTHLLISYCCYCLKYTCSCSKALAIKIAKALVYCCTDEETLTPPPPPHTC